MSAAGVGSFLGALVGFYLISRLVRWLLKRFGDTALRVVLADGITLVLSLGIWSMAGETPGVSLAEHLWMTTIAFGICLAVDLVAWRGRTARVGRSI